MKMKNMQILIGIGLFLLAVGAVLAITLVKKPVQTPQKDVSQLEQSQDDLDVIPTVGPDVQVDLAPVVPKKEIKLLVSGIPANTESIEYELTYSTQEQESEGVFSTARPKGSDFFPTQFERTITLGTCSKNVCRYHSITSSIKVTLKFEGTYGARLFQKEFDVTRL